LIVNSRLLERKVENLLKHILKPENSFNKKKIQKKKFILLSKLVTDLFNNKNSRIWFNNISSLIILILNIYNEKFPLDMHSSKEENPLKRFNSDYKQILKEEFLNS
jgi:hypothetical protein